MPKKRPFHNQRERLKATLRQIQASEKFYAQHGKGLSFEEVFGEPLTTRKRRRPR